MKTKPMTSVIRIKRKRDCEPVGSVLLARKKGKFDNEKNGSSEEGQFFRFAGTVEEKLAHSTQVVSEQIKRAIEAQKIYKMPMLRSASCTKRRSSEPLMCEPRKLKVLNSQTFCEPVDDDKTSAKRRCTILGNGLEKVSKYNENIDPKNKTKKEVGFQSASFNSLFDVNQPNYAETKNNELMCNNVKMVREKLTLNDSKKSSNSDDSDFVYDLYYCENAAKAWEMGDLLYIQPYQFDYHHSSSEEDNGEDSDSNDEGNWRNDYPDEGSSDSSSDEERILMMEEEDELDREEDGFSDCDSYDNDGYGGVGDDGSKYPIDNHDEEVDYYDDFADEIDYDNDYNDDYANNDDQYNDNDNADDDADGAL